MKPAAPSDSSDPLLDDILAEATPPDFRAALLSETLRHARHRRHLRQAGTAALACVVPLALLLTFVARHSSQPLPADPLPPAPAGLIVHTPAASSPLATARVATQALTAAQFVSSRPLSGASLVRTSPELSRLRFIDDAELLALAAPRPAALIRTGPHAQQLVFADEPPRLR